MEKLAAKRLIGKLVKVHCQFDGEYVCRLLEVTEGPRWRGKVQVVGVLRILNGPDGCRMPFAEDFVFEAYSSQVRTWSGADIGTWRDSALAAAQREVTRLETKVVPVSDYLQEVLAVQAKLASGEAGRVPEKKLLVAD